MTSGDDSNTNEIVFVHVDYTIGSDTGKQAAKAHTAQINWKRHRQRVRNKRLRRPERAAEEEEHSGEELSGSVKSTLSRRTGSSVDYFQRSRSQASLWEPARSLSPTFGALETATFPQSWTPMTSRVAEHCLKIMWPEFLYAENIRAAWFRAFCEQPIIFHGFHCAAAVHADSLAGNMALSSSAEILKHKDRTLQLLNKMISMPDFDANLVIHAILPLTHIELPGPAVTDELVLPFSPHFPSAGWPRIFGNIIAFTPHMQGLEWLVQRIGGLHAISFPGLGSVIAFCDLITSSVEVRKPTYSCFWEVPLTQRVPNGLMHSVMEEQPGRGFIPLLSEQIYEELLGTLTQLAKVDAEMARCKYRRLSEQDYRTLIFARNAAQHRLLCLEPAKFEASQSLDQRHTLKLNEICRMSAILYTNSVMFPLPPSRPWRERLLEPLTKLLHDSDIQTLRHRSWQLLAWASCVAALAARDLRYGKDLETVIRTMLSEGHVSSLNTLIDIFAQFLWSSEACGSALAGMWNGLASDNTKLPSIQS